MIEKKFLFGFESNKNIYSIDLNILEDYVSAFERISSYKNVESLFFHSDESWTDYSRCRKKIRQYRRTYNCLRTTVSEIRRILRERKIENIIK